VQELVGILRPRFANDIMGVRAKVRTDVARCERQQDIKNTYFRASLVAQWLRVRLPMQGTR
ncbi:hypothetical protein DBR06_SOUSAS31310009, partial [Sousa chinensis]